MPIDFGFLSTTELAKRLGVTDRTIRYWITAKLIFPTSKTVRGHNRFSHSEYERIKNLMENKNGT